MRVQVDIQCTWAQLHPYEQEAAELLGFDASDFTKYGGAGALTLEAADQDLVEGSDEEIVFDEYDYEQLGGAESGAELVPGTSYPAHGTHPSASAAAGERIGAVVEGDDDDLVFSGSSDGEEQEDECGSDDDEVFES